jgi:hypothetical protein
MTKAISELFDERNEMTKKGQIVEIAEKFFAPDGRTIDFEGSTKNRAELVERMKQFLGTIAKVNGITFHRGAVSGDTSFAEFTFDFDIKDGSKIYWHEIIRSLWKNGQIVEEQYFKA